MPTSRARQPKPDRRRALELLAGCGADGCTEAIVLAHGFTVDDMVELVRAALATGDRRPGVLASRPNGHGALP